MAVVAAAVSGVVAASRMCPHCAAMRAGAGGPALARSSGYFLARPVSFFPRGLVKRRLDTRWRGGTKDGLLFERIGGGVGRIAPVRIATISFRSRFCLGG